MPLSVGTKLGPYEILAPIGAGGMGEVYKARDTRLNRIVAVKVSKEQFSERFEQEARAVAPLNHPHICQHLGDSDIDFPASHRILKQMRYKGWICVDRDRTRNGPRELYALR